MVFWFLAILPAAKQSSRHACLSKLGSCLKSLKSRGEIIGSRVLGGRTLCMAGLKEVTWSTVLRAFRDDNGVQVLGPNQWMIVWY